MTEHPDLARLLALDHAALVGRLTPGVLHEVNNSLAVVLGYAQAMQMDLKSGRGDSSAAEDLETLESQAVTCGDTLAELHRFARPLADSTEGLVDLAGVLRDASSLLEYQLRRRRAHLSFKISSRADGSSFWVSGAQDRIRYVALELLANAVEASDDSAILVSLHAGSTSVVLEIEDRGAGMSPAVLQEAFKPFFTTRERGTGLGLPVCRHVLESCGGELDLVSDEAKGTTVTCRFPAAAPKG